MRKIRILVLTDHYTHGKGESIYELLQTMLAHPNALDIVVCSRGNKKNKDFFINFNEAIIYGKSVDSEFNFSTNNLWYIETEPMEISSFDVLFLHLDRPLTDEQLYKLRDNIKDLIIINDPRGIIETGSKKFLLG